MQIKKLRTNGPAVYILLDEEDKVIDWAELDNIERLEARIQGR